MLIALVAAPLTRRLLWVHVVLATAWLACSLGLSSRSSPRALTAAPLAHRLLRASVAASSRAVVGILILTEEAMFIYVCVYIRD